MTSQDTDDTITDEEGSALLADPPEPAADDRGPAADDTEAGAEGNQEAAKYRRKLREAEAERDALRGRLESMQRTEAERAAGRVLADASDLWGAVELADVLDEEGALDPKAVVEKAEDLVRRKPHFRAPAGPPSKRRDGPAINGGDADLAGGGHRPASWAEVLGGQGR